MLDYADALARSLIHAVLRWPLCVVIVFFIALLAVFLPLSSLQQDTRADAFLDEKNPALLYRDIVKDQFGLTDPYFVALIDHGEDGIFNTAAIGVLITLSREISELRNIDAKKVISLATADNITASDEGFSVQPFIDDLPLTPQSISALRQNVNNFPLYRDSLVGPSGTATVIVADMIDDSASGDTYEKILEIVARLELPPNLEVHVAGEGAIAGYLGAYIDADARKLIPLAVAIVLFVVSLAFRSILPALLALVVVAASIGFALGLMSLFDIPFYVITNTMPVILVGISVADSIHVFAHFYDLRALNPQAEHRELVLKTVGDMWRPVTATSLTTSAGFLGLYFASEMPPFKYFGLFSAVGVMIAWLYSLIFLPAAMILLGAWSSVPDQTAPDRENADAFSEFMIRLGTITVTWPKLIVALFACFAVIGLYSAGQLTVDGNRVELFDRDEPIYRADVAINEHLYGTNTLDIVVETPVIEGIFQPDNLRKIEDLQQFAEALPHVTGSTSIVDYFKQMNRAMNGGGDRAHVLPDSSDLAAQYFLLYSMSSDPSDFEEEVDYDYQMANVRVTINSGRYKEFSTVVESIEAYLKDSFNSETISATQSGRVNLNYHWLKNIGSSHFHGLAISILLVYVVASLLYRSLVAGLLALIPVCSAVLSVYAFMSLTGMTLEIGTSMFAAVAIGLGVDFAIHTLDRLRAMRAETDMGLEAVFQRFYASTGRALLFNWLAVASGFGVLLFSKVTQLSDFGSVVVLSMLISFIASMTLAPALLLLCKPGFIDSKGRL